jgi:alcohol dehydrogenase class IV
VEWLFALRAAVGIPHTLRDAGIPQADLAGLAALAATDIAVLDNPVPLGEAETLDLYLRAFAGEVR